MKEKKLETRKEILDYLGELSKQKLAKMKLIVEERSKMTEENWDAEKSGELILEFSKLKTENHLLNEIQMKILGE